ncbi:MAG TPA: glycerophosphodiester phosphodiesterase family protein [Opitutaceae bacterium]|nr:glycerophosphodiester phosphodiesterase family protein [Opitutaceae bacterium]
MKTNFPLRCGFLGLLLLCAPRLASAQRGSYQLIAHRGGIVETRFPDNSPAAFQAAVERHYWGVECDIRETADGVLVMQHDPNLKLNFGDPRQIRATTWAEMSQLRTSLDGQGIWRFEDIVRYAHAAGLRLMLDSKNPHSPEFPAKVDAILQKYAMVDRCYLIGADDVKRHFLGRAMVGYNLGTLQALLAQRPELRSRCFLFEEGIKLTPAMVEWAIAHDITVIPSINGYHYYDPRTMSGKSRPELEALILPQARRHIEQFQKLGVTVFQIDSEFERYFPAAGAVPSH